STTQGTASSGAQPGSENEPGIDLGYPPAKPDSPAPSPDDPRGSGTVGFGENSTGAGTIKHQAARGVGWTSSLQMYRVVLQMITTWILAIMLPQSAFGLVGAAAGIVGFLLLFKDLGTGPAIVQRRDLNYDTLSTLFWINVTLGLGGATAIFLAAPVVG